MMLEEALVNSFLTLSYNEANFFQRSLSITKSLVYFYQDDEFLQQLTELDTNCANILQTKSGKHFYIPYHVLEQAYLKHADMPPDTTIEFELTNYESRITESYELSLTDIHNYLLILHDKMLSMIIRIAKKHGIALGDVSGYVADSKFTVGSPSQTSKIGEFELPKL